MEGWHFSNGKEVYGRHRKITAGKMLKVKGPVRLCAHGLHASARAIDALTYSSGSIVSRVRLSGEIVMDTDKAKAVATERTHLQVADATNLLHEFGCWCAERALLAEREAGRESDLRSWAVIEAKRKWLRGEITDRDLRAAASAASRAASERAAAERSASERSAAERSAAAAVASSEMLAERSAAAASEMLAARSAAAASAERVNQNDELERRLYALLEAAHP